MRKILIIIVTLCPFFLLGQSAQFIYDDAGNRTAASVIINLVSNEELAELQAANEDLESLDIGNEQFFEELDIKVFPNPTTAEVNITSNPFEVDTEASVYLYTQEGKQLLTAPFSGKQQLNLESYANGVYYVHVLIGKESRTYKVIKIN